jgi:hypothetical protein
MGTPSNQLCLGNFPINGPLCTRYREIVNKCCELSPLFCPLVLLFDEWRDKFEGATVKKDCRYVHANTITFLGPAVSHTNPHYTYTICMGSASFNSIKMKVSVMIESWDRPGQHKIHPGISRIQLRVNEATCCLYYKQITKVFFL